MVICCVVASESLLTYDPVRSGGIPHSALHLTIPEQAQLLDDVESSAAARYCMAPLTVSNWG
jgi:hypothetical protein